MNMNKLITVAAVAASMMVPVASRAAGFSICAVGDSITQGGNTGFVAHRIALEHVLDANDWSVEWKGTRTDPSWGSSNPCEGYSGQNAQSVAANYVAHAASVVADVLLLHAGHNYNVDPDMSDPAYMPEADIIAAATNAHAQIIAAARAQNPNVIVLYAQVITSGKLPKYTYIPALNSGIAALAAELNTTASPVVAVDMADGWNYATDCVSDMVHPNAAGANKMAAKWFAALEAQVAAGKLTVVLKERAPVSVARDITLGQDTDWRGNGPVNIEPNATVNSTDTSSTSMAFPAAARCFRPDILKRRPRLARRLMARNGMMPFRMSKLPPTTPAMSIHSTILHPPTVRR